MNWLKRLFHKDKKIYIANVYLGYAMRQYGFTKMRDAFRMYRQFGQDKDIPQVIELDKWKFHNLLFDYQLTYADPETQRVDAKCWRIRDSGQIFDYFSATNGEKYCRYNCSVYESAKIFAEIEACNIAADIRQIGFPTVEDWEEHGRRVREKYPDAEDKCLNLSLYEWKVQSEKP